MSLKRTGVARDIKERTSGDTEEKRWRKGGECGVAMMENGRWPASVSDACSIPFPSER